MKFCMVGSLQGVVLRFKFHLHRLSGFGAVGVEICPSTLNWPLAYTTACTTIQAVMGSAFLQIIDLPVGDLVFAWLTTRDGQRPTDHATWSVTIGRIYVRRT